jgi:phage terminase large subunit
MFAGLKTNPESIKSMEGVTKVWVEEAQTISQESIDLLIPTIRADGSEIWWTFNRGMKTDPVDKMFFGKDGPPPDTLIRKVNYYDNPWFPDVLRQQMEWDRSRDPDKYRHVWLGEPVMHSNAQVFYGCWSIAPVPEPPEDTVFYYGADWGFAQDPTAIVRCWIDGKTLYVDREAGGVGIEIDDTPRLLDTVVHDRRWKITADSARPETISYMNRNGFNVVASKKGKGSIEDGIARLKGYNIVVDPSCKRVIEELSLYSYKTDKRTGEITPMIEDKNNNFLDALRYATEALTRRKYFIPTL